MNVKIEAKTLEEKLDWIREGNFYKLNNNSEFVFFSSSEKQFSYSCNNSLVLISEDKAKELIKSGGWY